MRLTEREQERLLVFTAAELARRHLWAGRKLSAPEAIAVMCDAMFESASAGAEYADVLAAGYTAVTPNEVMDGVPVLVDEIRLEVLMGDGTRLVVLRNPLGASADTGSRQTAEPTSTPNRERRTLTVTNTGARAIRVSSRFPLEKVNAHLAFDRDAARGFHLDIAVGQTARWAPGETRDVTLIRRG